VDIAGGVSRTSIVQKLLAQANVTKTEPYLWMYRANFFSLIFLIGFTVLKLSSSVREYGSHHKYKTGSRRSLRIYSKIKIHAFRTVLEHLRRVLEPRPAYMHSLTWMAQ
jgi:hypothetical protein